MMIATSIRSGATCSVGHGHGARRAAPTSPAVTRNAGFRRRPPGFRSSRRVYTQFTAPEASGKVWRRRAASHAGGSARGIATLRVCARAQGKGCEYITLEADGSDSWKLDQVADLLQRGAVGIIPTDTMYALVCDINNAKAVDQIYKIKEMNPKKPLAILCRNFQDIEEYTRGLPVSQSAGGRSIFKIVKDCLPGPFTLILPASKSVPKRCFKKANGDVTCANRREVGVRIPDDAICSALLALCPAPLLTTSVREEDVVMVSGLMEPARMFDHYAPRGLGFVVDGGARPPIASSVVDITQGDPVIVRAGAGDLSLWDLHEDDVDGDSPRYDLYHPVEASR